MSNCRDCLAFHPQNRATRAKALETFRTTGVWPVSPCNKAARKAAGTGGSSGGSAVSDSQHPSEKEPKISKGSNVSKSPIKTTPRSPVPSTKEGVETSLPEPLASGSSVVPPESSETQEEGEIPGQDDECVALTNGQFNTWSMPQELCSDVKAQGADPEWYYNAEFVAISGMYPFLSEQRQIDVFYFFLSQYERLNIETDPPRWSCLGEALRPIAENLLEDLEVLEQIVPEHPALLRLPPPSHTEVEVEEPETEIDLHPASSFSTSEESSEEEEVVPRRQTQPPKLPPPTKDIRLGLGDFKVPPPRPAKKAPPPVRKTPPGYLPTMGASEYEDFLFFQKYRRWCKEQESSEGSSEPSRQASSQPVFTPLGFRQASSQAVSTPLGSRSTSSRFPSVSEVSASRVASEVSASRVAPSVAPEQEDTSREGKEEEKRLRNLKIDWLTKALPLIKLKPPPPRGARPTNAFHVAEGPQVRREAVPLLPAVCDKVQKSITDFFARKRLKERTVNVFEKIKKAYAAPLEENNAFHLHAAVPSALTDYLHADLKSSLALASADERARLNPNSTQGKVEIESLAALERAKVHLQVANNIALDFMALEKISLALSKRLKEFAASSKDIPSTLEEFSVWRQSVDKLTDFVSRTTGDLSRGIEDGLRVSNDQIQLLASDVLKAHSDRRKAWLEFSRIDQAVQAEINLSPFQFYSKESKDPVDLLGPTGTVRLQKYQENVNRLMKRTSSTAFPASPQGQPKRKKPRGRKRRRSSKGDRPQDREREVSWDTYPVTPAPSQPFRAGQASRGGQRGRGRGRGGNSRGRGGRQ